MNKELPQEEIKKISFDILKHFKLFCEKHNIDFYLSNGTLLGAVKYRGFIPWDDDIDVLVPRDDYDRLIKIYEDSEKYKLFSQERDLNYKYSFAKLCDLTTLKIEDNIDNGISLGMDIDIFPLDHCSKDILRSSTQRKIHMYQIGCILSKFISSKGKPIHKRIVIKICRLLKFDFFCKRLTNIVEKEADKGNDFAGCLMWPIYGEKEVVPAEVFENKIEVEFEGIKFPAPSGYDKYLRSLYGDYEKDPPVEKQRSHHKFKAYHM